MIKELLEAVNTQLSKEHIADDVLALLHDDFMINKKKQEFITRSMLQYSQDAVLLYETLVWAQEKHNKQKQIITIVPDTGDISYFSHPLSMALYAMNLHFPCPMVQACLLHDVIEDCACTEKEVREIR